MLTPGRHFGNYQILNLLGSGGMGEVYLALDCRLNRNVALKVISPELLDHPDLLARFHREAGLAALLNHPNICTIYEAGEVDGQTYISMEFVEGRTLRDRIAGEPLGLRESLDIAIQIADALEEARKRSIVHRDVKSSNILLTRSGVVKILDFGLAKQTEVAGAPVSSIAVTECTLTHAGGVLGTVAYMSPEQALGRSVDHRSDIFSFGVVLYEMLTGRLPFKGASVTEVVDAILHRAPPPAMRYNNSVSQELARVLNKMLEKDPEDRYQSVHEVLVDLRRIRDESTGTIAASGRWFAGKRRFRMALTASVIALAALAVAAYWFNGRDRPVTKHTAAMHDPVSIAVMPFQYTGGDSANQYLGMLVTDGLIASLQSMSGIAVAPLPSVRRIEPNSSVSDAARELGVRWIIRGTVSTGGGDPVIAAELLSANGSTAWKETLSGSPLSAINVVRKSILYALNLEGAAGKESTQVRSPNLEAYRKYLAGRSLHEGWDVGSNIDQAILYYREALEKDPDFAAAHAALATALLIQFAQKHVPAVLAQANVEARRAIGLDSDLPEALIAYGMVLAQSGKSMEARDAFSRALELAPGDDSACRNLAVMYSSLDRNEDAREMYQKAIALRPGFWLNYYSLGSFEWQFAGNLKEAQSYLDKAYALNPSGYGTLVVLGDFYVMQGKLDEAEIYYRMALERSPNTYAYNNLGIVHYYRGQYDLALRNWEAVLKDAPEKAIYIVNVADALRQLRRSGEAQTLYRKAILGLRTTLKNSPTDETTRSGLAMALAATGACKEAIAETVGMITRHPKSPDLLSYAAITYSRCGETERAMQTALILIAAKNLLTVRFDPDLEPIRKLPEVQKALARIQD